MIYRPKHYYHGAWFKYPSRLSCSDVFVKSCMDLFVNILRHFLGILHYCDVIIGAIASQITNVMIISSTVYSSADQRKIKAPRHWSCVREIDWMMSHNAVLVPNGFSKCCDVIHGIWITTNIHEKSWIAYCRPKRNPHEPEFDSLSHQPSYRHTS